MTLFLSDREADSILPPAGKTPIFCPQTTECKLILDDPKQKSQGYRQRFEFASGLSLLIDSYKLHENLLVEAGGYEGHPEPDFELSFTLTGNNETEEVCFGQNFISTQIDEPEGKEFLWRSHQQILKIDVHISQKFFQQFGSEFLEASPFPLRQYIEADSENIPHFWHQERTTPAMRLIFDQMFNCPYQGMMRLLYLEGKCLELMALRLNEVNAGDRERRQYCLLKKDDIDRIYQAKEILISDLNNPPLLLELAKMVGLNDYKLKIGFRQVFNTTMFGYLQAYRMEQAKNLLISGQMKVQEIASLVGYASPSRFTAVFKRHFGVCPKDLPKKSGLS